MNKYKFKFGKLTIGLMLVGIVVAILCLVLNVIRFLNLINGNFELYIDGNLVSTAENFSMQMSPTSGSTAFILGDNLSSPSYSISGTAFASFRYYERSLTKDELENNRNFDLSIY